MFKGISTRQFDAFFKCEDDCRQYLFNIKWKKGYSCRRCGNEEFWKGRTRFHTRCKACDYNESVCANTSFACIKIPLLKAFKIAFLITVTCKGMSTKDLAGEFEINQKSAWLFVKKLQKALLASYSNSLPFETRRILDGIILGHRERKCNGLQKFEVAFAERRSKNAKGKLVLVKNVGQVIDDESFYQCDLVRGKYEGINRDIRMWNFKTWLTGTHHHCSPKNFNGYFGKFFFRSNLRDRKDLIWHQLIKRMVVGEEGKFHNNGKLLDSRMAKRKDG